MVQVITSVLDRTSVIESGRPDSNRRSQAPRACGLAGLSHALGTSANSPCGNRTHLSALKGRYPRPIDERAIHRVGRGALESPSAGLQPAAGPSQLPTRSVLPTKRPGVFVTPGLRLHTRDVRGRASRPQGIERERARRLRGGTLRFSATQDVTQTSGEHGRPRCKRCLRPTRLGAGLTAQPTVLYPFRRRTPQGRSRDSGGILGLSWAASNPLLPARSP